MYGNGDFLDFFNNIVNNSDLYIDEKRLDRLFGTVSYGEALEEVKEKGYRVFRNKEGKHKVIRDES